MNKIYFFENYIKNSEYETTMNRIASYFNNSEFTNDMKILNDPNNIVFLIDAYKSGLFLSNKKCKYIIIIGGLDISIDVYESHKYHVIRSCLFRAQSVIVFDRYIKIDLKFHFKNLTNIHVISQAVSRILIKPFNLRSYLNITDDRRLFVMIGNLNSIKDPLFLQEKFDILYSIDKTTLIIIGENVDEDYIFSESIIHLKKMDKERIHSILQQVDGLIDTSISQVINNTILEAMKLSCPVYARRNLGNISIINNYINGYIFETPDDFIKVIKYDTNFTIKKAIESINNFHSQIEEKKSYYKLVSLI